MKVITFGRNDNNDVIINDQFVGRNHCQIVENEGKIIVIDLNSTNGTYVNGIKIVGQQTITLSDEIRIGKTVLNWQAYFPLSQPISSFPQQPTDTSKGTSTKNRKKITIVSTCIVIFLAIVGITAYFFLQPYTKHASALPHNMMTLMSFNINELQKQTEVTQNDLSQLFTRMFSGRADINHSGINFSAPIYAFIEDVDIIGNNHSYGLVIPISNKQQFGEFVLNFLNIPNFKKYNDIQYDSQNNVFIGFDGHKCLFYVSTYMNDNQVENKGFELLGQEASHSGKRSKLFRLLKDNPVSCVVSGDEYERAVNTLSDVRNLWNILGLNVAGSYLSIQLVAQNDGLGISLSNIDSKSVPQKYIFNAIKGTQLSNFSADDVAFAAINVNGVNLLREVLQTLSPEMRANVNDLFEEFNKKSIDLENFIRAIDGDVYLSLQNLSYNNSVYADTLVTSDGKMHISYNKAHQYKKLVPNMIFMAEMPSSSEINSSVKSVKNFMEYDYDFRTLFESVETNGNFLVLKSRLSNSSYSNISQQQNKNSICNKYMYVSLDIDQLLSKTDSDRDIDKLKPYINYVKRVSVSCSSNELSLQFETTKDWKYILSNL